MSKLIGIIDYNHHISRRYTILCGIGSLLDGLISIMTLGVIGSAFSYKFTLYSARTEMKNKSKNNQ